MRLRFVSAHGGDSYMHELLAVVAHEVAELGTDTTLSQGAFPPWEPDDVYVMIPHDFLAVPHSLYPSSEQLDRTIALCVEHPGTKSFEMSAQWAAVAGRVIDINDDSASTLRALGIPAERFHLGYSSAWDCWRGDESVPRERDVVYLGTTEPRRSRALATYSELLAPREVRLLMPPHERMATPRPDFLMGAAKWEWLRGSKILLNLHRGQSVSLEWVRTLEALCNGCVVVSEHSVDYQPLEPGRHIVFGHWRALGELADRLLSDPAELDRVRHAAYAFLTNELTMRPSARRLVELAGDLLSSPGRCQSAPSTTRPVEPDAITSLRASEHDGAVYVPSQLPDLPPGARPALAHSLRRPVERPRRRPELARTPPRAAGSVDAIVVQGRGDPSPGMTVASILGQGEALDLQVLVGLTEKETKRSAPALRDPRVVVEDDDPASTLGAVRNRLLARSDADYVLVVEPVDTLLPGALHRLAEVLQQSSGVEACYPMTAEADGEIGNALPFEPDRLEEHDYLSTPALWRRDALVALGGWCDDPQLEALESYDLWHRLAAAGGSAELLPQALVRRRLRPLRLLRLSDIDPERTRHALRSRTERCSQVGSSL